MPYAAAAGAVFGSWLLIGVPLAVGLALAAVCALRPSPLLAFAVFAVLAGFFGARALDGLADPPQGRIEGWVTLLDDPRPLGTNGIRVTVRHAGARVEARAYGAVAARLDDALAGERVRVSGTARPATGDWHRWRHVAATLTVDSVGERAGAAPVAALANRIRRLLESGAASLPDDSRAMFAGMVYGDDRSQSPRLYDDFRAAGLGHLLVVSGQNVAFVLALASPLVTRARPGVRLVVLLALLGVFALLTRFEPSVLRAVAMAGTAVTSAALGRPETGRRTLAWAVAGVLLADPFLVRVLAFQLSVCATCGLLWITPVLAEMLPGPPPAAPGGRHHRGCPAGGDAAAGGRLRHRPAGVAARQCGRRPGVGSGDDVGSHRGTGRGSGRGMAGVADPPAHRRAALVDRGGGEGRCGRSSGRSGRGRCCRGRDGRRPRAWPPECRRGPGGWRRRARRWWRSPSQSAS